MAVIVTPCVGVWIETLSKQPRQLLYPVTPCVGVWIETTGRSPYVATDGGSHPAWVCGLKPIDTTWLSSGRVTPCVGVWIETNVQAAPVGPLIVTPCVGVWIETSNSVQTGWPISSHPAWVYMD